MVGNEKKIALQTPNAHVKYSITLTLICLLIREKKKKGVILEPHFLIKLLHSGGNDASWYLLQEVTNSNAAGIF